MATTWNVTGQAAEQFEFDGAGNAITGYRVSFITGAGQKGSVFIPEAQYHADNVRAAIAVQAAKMDAVAALSSAG